jgi:hypothetical protein
MFRKLVSAALAVCLTVGVSSVFAQDNSKVKGMASKGGERGIIIINGKVTKVEDGKATVRNDSGREIAVDVKDASGLKVGDTVNVKDGRIERSGKRNF